MFHGISRRRPPPRSCIDDHAEEPECRPSPSTLCPKPSPTRRAAARARSPRPPATAPTRCAAACADAHDADGVVLASVMPFRGESPYAARSPVYVHAERCAGHAEEPGAVPEMLRGRLLSVRAYDGVAHADGHGGAPGNRPRGRDRAAARRRDPGAYLHVHFAGPGCFACRIDRAACLADDERAQRAVGHLEAGLHAILVAAPDRVLVLDREDAVEAALVEGVDEVAASRSGRARACGSATSPSPSRRCAPPSSRRRRSGRAASGKTSASLACACATRSTYGRSAATGSIPSQSRWDGSKLSKRPSENIHSQSSGEYARFPG